MDGIELEILWSNLIGIVSEQAKALIGLAPRAPPAAPLIEVVVRQPLLVGDILVDLHERVKS